MTAIALGREHVERLQAALLQLPQSTDFVTESTVHGGMLRRTVWRPAGTVIAGKVHKLDHLFIVMSGHIKVWNDNGVVDLHAGDVIECKAGTKRATFAVTDATAMTIHRLPESLVDADPDSVEHVVVEDDPTSAFGIGNALKAIEVSK